MATKLHRHFDVNGTELEPTYIELSDEELEAEIDTEAREEAIKEIAKKKKPAIRARKLKELQGR